MQSRVVPLGKLIVGEHNVRMDGSDPELAALSDSIKDVGLIQPIVVEEREEGLLVVAGHRRYFACRMAGVIEVPVRILEADGGDAGAVVFAENEFRSQPTPIELAAAIKDRLGDGRMTEEAIANGFKRSIQWVRDQVALLDLPGDVTLAIHTKQLTAGAGRWLGKVEDEPYRRFLMENAIGNGITVRGAEAWYRGWVDSRPAAETVQIEPPGGGLTSEAIVPKAPCGGCREDFRPAELVYGGYCGNCQDQIRQFFYQMALAGS